MKAVFASVKLEPEFHAPMFGTLIHQVICVHRSSSDLLGEDVHSEKSETNGINNAALALPILAKDVVLARDKVELGLGKRPEAIES
jgi:hypothetical protein